MRAKLRRALCLLGSATPSLERFANAGPAISPADAPKRVDDRQLPHIDVVDMRIEMHAVARDITLSRVLVDKMHDRLERREQIILFINRRGYSSGMLCTACGHVETCAHCSIAMTYHRTDETLRCHLCGDQRPAPALPAMPVTENSVAGTRHAEGGGSRAPGAAPRARRAHGQRHHGQKEPVSPRCSPIFGWGDRCPGGHPDDRQGARFSNVTLVGLIDADLSMHVPDFRATERTFQLLVQVAGRAGRGDRAGDVVVQTFTPQAHASSSRGTPISTALPSRTEDPGAFHYPPYRHLVHHLFRGPNPEKLKFFAEPWANWRGGLGTPRRAARAVALADRKDQGRISLAALVFHGRGDAGHRRPRAPSRRLRLAGRPHADAGRGPGEPRLGRGLEPGVWSQQRVVRATWCVTEGKMSQNPSLTPSGFPNLPGQCWRFLSFPPIARLILSTSFRHRTRQSARRRTP